MAIFNITYDSVTKQATVTKDGEAVGDLNEVRLCRCGWEEPAFALHVEQGMRDKDNKTFTRVSTYAAETVVTDTYPKLAERAKGTAEGRKLLGLS